MDSIDGERKSKRRRTEAPVADDDVAEGNAESRPDAEPGRKDGVQILRLRLPTPKMTPTHGTPLKLPSRRTPAQLEADKLRKRQKRREQAAAAAVAEAAAATAVQAEPEPEVEPAAPAPPEDPFGGYLEGAAADLGDRKPSESDKRRFDRAKGVAEVTLLSPFCLLHR
jgi:hypothetical protein